MFPLLGDFMPLMTLFNGQVCGYSLFKSGQRKFGEGTYLDKNMTALESSYCLVSILQAPSPRWFGPGARSSGAARRGAATGRLLSI